MTQLNYQYASKLEETRQRLRGWGSWYRATLRMGLDFSSKSIVGQLIDSQGVLIRSTAENLAPENAMAEEIDTLINQLATEQEKIAKVLCYHYTSDGTTSERIQQSGLARRTYYLHLSDAEEWINHRLP